MSKTFASIASHRFANTGQSVMMPLALTTIGTLVWYFEFGLLEFV